MQSRLSTEAMLLLENSALAFPTLGKQEQHLQLSLSKALGCSHEMRS